MTKNKFERRLIGIELQGKTPLLVHSPRAMDLTVPWVQELRKITSKQARSMTVDDDIRISDLEFMIALYYDEKLGPIVEDHHVIAMIRSGAKKRRKGQDVNRALRVKEHQIPIEYDGPRKLEELVKDSDFRDRRRISLGVLRTRPKFFPWKVRFTLDYDINLLDFDGIRDYLELAGEYEGFMDARRIGFGRFAISKFGLVNGNKPKRRRRS